jgi:glycerol kinase
MAKEIKKYILALDQGTTSSRAILFDENANMVASVQKEFTQIFPQQGWVEHDADEIWDTQISVAKKVIKKAKIEASQIASIGITNQRETTILWDKTTGKPVYHAIVWQDRRTAPLCEKLKEKGLETVVRHNTGLVIDAYFSATKINWILENVAGVKEKAEKGNILFGTVDTWLLWKLTNGAVHATDYSNSSRTMIFNIRRLVWDSELIGELGVGKIQLPEVLPSSHPFGIAHKSIFGTEIPITGIAGDQQAALFGQQCWDAGTAKNTYGTGCFMLMNTGPQIIKSEAGLLTTIAWGVDNKVDYALEGSVFIAGAAIQWLRDSMQIIKKASDTEQIVKNTKDNAGVYVVPAFVGLGTPYWDMYARGAIFGLTRDAGRAAIVRATLESLAYQTKDVLDAMQSDSKIELKKLKVDGGACANNFLMQFQSDMLHVPVVRPSNIESTALGAALLAGLQIGLYTKAQLTKQEKVDTTFKPSMDAEKRKSNYEGWKKAVARTLGWLN